MLRKAIAKGVPSAPGYVPGIYVQKLAQLAEESRLDFTAVLQRLPAAHRPRPEQLGRIEIPYADYHALVRGLLDAAREPGDGAGFGLRFARKFGVADYGILGYAMMSCANLGQCLQTFQHLNALFGRIDELQCRFVWQDDTVLYRCHSSLADPELVRFELETALGQFMRLRDLLAEPARFSPRLVRFEYPAPPSVDLYESIFGCEVRFGQARSELVLPEPQLAAEFALANAEAREACEQQCEIMVKDMTTAGSLTGRVRHLILQSPGEIPELDGVARRLNVSARTLRRKLALENTAYHEIVNQVREHLARRYLGDTGLSVKEIGYLLGYSEVANFQRAFKKWVGKTPGDYRRAAAARARPGL